MIGAARRPRREVEHEPEGQPDEAVPAHAVPAGTHGFGPCPRQTAGHEDQPVQRDDEHESPQDDPDPPRHGPRQFGVHAYGERFLQRVEALVDVEPRIHVVDFTGALEIIILPQAGDGLGNPLAQGGNVFLQLPRGPENPADADLHGVEAALRLDQIVQKGLQFRGDVGFALRGRGILLKQRYFAEAAFQRVQRSLKRPQHFGKALVEAHQPLLDHGKFQRQAPAHP